MFKFCSLFSGSTGNSLLVETDNSKILVDAGESAKKIVNALSLVDQILMLLLLLMSILTM